MGLYKAWAGALSDHSERHTVLPDCFPYRIASPYPIQDQLAPAFDMMHQVSYALQASLDLYSMVESFPKSPRRVRNLKEELSSLNFVLKSLRDILSSITEVDVSELILPLKECGKVCGRFQQEFTDPFRPDWDNLRFNRGSIDNFTQLLNGYKSTFKRAVGAGNM